MVDVRHGGLVPAPGHAAARPHRFLLRVGVAEPVPAVVRELDQPEQQIDLGLRAHVHRLHGRTAAVRHVFHRGPVTLLAEHQLVICNHHHTHTRYANIRYGARFLEILLSKRAGRVHT